MMAIYVLSSGIKKNEDHWICTPLNEQDSRWGAPGGDIRIKAAAVLLAENPNAMIITTGAVGFDMADEFKNVSRPNLSTILKKELISLGVSADKIIEESNSNTTYQQLQALVSIIDTYRLDSVMILTNKYHISRVEAIIKYSRLLKIYPIKNIKIFSAEDVLLQHNATWSNYIDSCYGSPRLKEIIKKEEQGVADLKNGTYKLV